MDQRTSEGKKERVFSRSWEWPVPGCCLCVCESSVSAVYTSAGILLDGSYSVIGNDSGQSLAKLALSAWNQYLALPWTTLIVFHLIVDSNYSWLKVCFSHSYSFITTHIILGWSLSYHSLWAMQQVDSACHFFIHPSQPTFSWRSYPQQSEFNKLAVFLVMWALSSQTKKKPLGWLKYNIFKLTHFWRPVEVAAARCSRRQLRRRSFVTSSPSFIPSVPTSI